MASQGAGRVARRVRSPSCVLTNRRRRPGPLATPDDALAEALCTSQSGGRQRCNLRLPPSLLSGATYWIMAQFRDINGSWVTARPVSGGLAENPRPVVVD